MIDKSQPTRVASVQAINETQPSKSVAAIFKTARISLDPSMLTLAAAARWALEKHRELDQEWAEAAAEGLAEAEADDPAAVAANLDSPLLRAATTPEQVGQALMSLLAALLPTNPA